MYSDDLRIRAVYDVEKEFKAVPPVYTRRAVSAAKKKMTASATTASRQSHDQSHDYVNSAADTIKWSRRRLFEDLRSSVPGGSAQDDVQQQAQLLSFQAISWHGCDDRGASMSSPAAAAMGGNDRGDEEEEEEEEEEDEDGIIKPIHPSAAAPYVIRAFGVQRDGTSVALTIRDFTPFFYVKLSHADSSSRYRMDDAVRKLVNECEYIGPRSAPGGFRGATLMKRGDFWGFNNDAQFTYVRLCFASAACMRRAANRLSMQLNMAVYESHIDPMLRFFHIRNISPADWITVTPSPKSKRPYRCSPPRVPGLDLGHRSSTAEIIATCTWQEVGPVSGGGGTDMAMAPVVLAAFDIECNSAHGDFPQARKNYRKLATDLDQAWDRLKLRTINEYDAKEAIKVCMRAAFWGPSLTTPAQMMTPAQMTTPTPVPGPASAAPPASNGEGEEQGAADVESKKSAEDAIQRAHEYVANNGIAHLQLKTQGLLPSTRGGRALETTIRRVVDDLYQTMVSPPPPKSQSQSQQPAASGGGGGFGDDDEGGENDLDTSVGRLVSILDGAFNGRWPLRGDEVIQIGTTVSVVGETHCRMRVVLVLGSCDSSSPASTSSASTSSASAPVPESAPIEVRSFDNELDLLLAWVELIRALDPDVILGYNILGFDLAYIYHRALDLFDGNEDACARRFLRLGRIEHMPSQFVTQTLSSSALGDNTLRYLDMHGRVMIDIMKVVQRDHKLDSYKLDNVAAHFLKLRKHDVSPQDVFRLQRGSAADRRVIAEYCVQDCELCNLLAAKLQLLANNMGMANVCSVPLSFIFMRGQGVKIFSLVAKQCRADGLLIPLQQRRGGFHGGGGGADDGEEGYEGAIVLEPETGMYLDDPVSVLDYNSLYPSSMISHNLSHDSLVLDMPQYGNIPGVDYCDVVFDVYEGKGDQKRRIGQQSCRFVQGRDGQRKYAVLPRILQRLLDARKMTRKRMKHVRVVIASTPPPDASAGAGSTKATDAVIGSGSQVLVGELNETTRQLTVNAGTAELRVVQLSEAEAASAHPAYNAFECAVLDGLQLAYKVTANSLYGQMGARTSALYLKQVAACTTAVGRQMILIAKEYVEKPEVGGRVVYGDSVAANTPVLLRIVAGSGSGTGAGAGETESIFYEAIASVADRVGAEWKSCACEGPGRETKEAAEMPPGVETWSDAGWTPLRRVIRHVLAPHKRMLRVLTRASMVDVTDDHSLIRADEARTTVSPQDLCVGDALLHAVALPTFPDFAKLPGPQEIQDDGEDGAVRTFEFDTPGPAYVSAPPDGAEAYGGGTSFPATAAATLFALGESRGFNVTLDHISCDDEDALPTLIMRWARRSGHRIADSDADPMEKSRVTRIIPLRQSESPTLVYDLTTDNHHFAAGIGRMVVHNTDSIFVVFKNVDKETGDKLKGTAALASSISQGQAVSRGIAPTLPKPHFLEYEKTMFPLILLSKKRYVGLLYEDDAHARPKQKSMGIALKRRDYAPIVKTIYGGMLDILLNDRDVPQATRFLVEQLRHVADGQVLIQDYVITKSLAATYKMPQRIAHWVLARRMYERDPGSAPQVNERIPYVFIETSKPNALMGDRIEHVDYVRTHLAGGCLLPPPSPSDATKDEASGSGKGKGKGKGKNGAGAGAGGTVYLDTKTYIETQIMKPCVQLLSIALEQIPGYVQQADLTGAKALSTLVDAKNGDVKKARERLDTLREREVERLLFEPVLSLPVFKNRDNRCRGQLSITRFFGSTTATTTKRQASSSVAAASASGSGSGSPKTSPSKTSPKRTVSTKPLTAAQWVASLPPKLSGCPPAAASATATASTNNNDLLL